MTVGLLLLSFLGQAPVATALAAPAWTTVDVKPELATFYSDHLAQALRGHGLKVITASEMRAVLTSQRQLALLGCAGDGSSCITELASALGAELTLLGSIAKLDDGFELHLKVLRASTGAVLSETRVSANSQKALLDELPGAAARLTEPLGTAPRASIRPWAILPGVAALAGAGVGAFLLYSAHGTYDQLARSLNVPADADSATARSLASAGSNQQLGGWISVSVGIAAAIVAVVLLVVGGAP